MGLSSEPILFPIRQASDFSRLSLSEEYNWNVAQVWNIVSSELTSDVRKPALPAYADSLISLSPILIPFTSSFSHIRMNSVSTHRMNKYADNGSSLFGTLSSGKYPVE